MKRPAYSSAQPQGLRRFQKMPRKEAARSEEPLPRHPKRLELLESLTVRVAQAHLDDPKGTWGITAFPLWEWLVTKRDAAQKRVDAQAKRRRAAAR